MLYFDSTYLFRIYSVEPGHEAVKELLAQANQPVAVAWHGRAEIASILLRKRREGADTPEQLSSLAKQFQDDCHQQLIHFLPLTEAVMTRLESVLAAAPAPTNIRAARKQKVARLLIESDLAEEAEPRQKAAEKALAEANAIENHSP